MKKITMMFAVLILISIVTVSCSDDGTDDTTNNQDSLNVEEGNSNLGNNEFNDTDNESSSNSNENIQTGKYDDAVSDNDGATEKMKELNIEEIELGVEYADDIEYEAEIELKSDGVYTSQLEDDINNENIKGQDAFDKLYPMVEKLDLNEDSSKEEVFNQVLKAFELEDDYEKIEVEINFHDSNKELDYEEKR